jgi:hypothetical protein
MSTRFTPSETPEKHGPKCDGNCMETHGAHVGVVQRVLVMRAGFPEMRFSYCENAIQEDERRGYFVVRQL